MHWDVFCRVIDNHGDLGVCWRFARDLAARGDGVRLWVDDARALAWMAPHPVHGVTVRPWPAATDAAHAGIADTDVVVEAFGCDLPAATVAAMAARPRPPVWVNLEYLSAEAYVERSHRLASPQMSGPGRGLTKWFFYPGFTPATGGLLREPGLAAARRAHDRGAWLAGHGIEPRPGERVVSVFCYPQAPLDALAALLAGEPTVLLLTPGAPAVHAPPAAIRTHALPYLDQPGYDQLLWSCDMNLVRGEDSFVRAQWAGAPFVWHIYPQDDGAHAIKLHAFLQRFLAGAAPEIAASLRALWNGWNGLGGMPAALPASGPWRALCDGWQEARLAEEDLVTQLRQFVLESR